MMPSPDHGGGLPHTSQVLTRLRADRTSLVRLCKNERGNLYLWGLSTNSIGIKGADLCVIA